MDSIGSRKVDSVMPAELTNFSQLAGAAHEGVIDFDEVDLLPVRAVPQRRGASGARPSN